MTETRKHDWGRFDALTDAEVHEAALADPDARPLSDEALAQMKPVPRAQTLRRALGLTQEEFAARYHIPIGTLRDWEQGRSEPDQPARAYLSRDCTRPRRCPPRFGSQARLRKLLTVSVIGCVVIGPGEARETDIGFTGGSNGTYPVYLSGLTDHRLKDTDIVDHLVELVEKKAAQIEAEKQHEKDAELAAAP